MQPPTRVVEDIWRACQPGTKHRRPQDVACVVYCAWANITLELQRGNCVRVHPLRLAVVYTAVAGLVVGRHKREPALQRKAFEVT